jgi:hypothetical protein
LSDNLSLQFSNSEDVEKPPTLLQPLVDLVVAAGSSALFVCKVCGRPRPTIEWSGPGRAVIVPNERTKLNYSDNNVVTLQVNYSIFFPNTKRLLNIVT